MIGLYKPTFVVSYMIVQGSPFVFYLLLFSVFVCSLVNMQHIVVLFHSELVSHIRTGHYQHPASQITMPCKYGQTFTQLWAWSHKILLHSTHIWSETLIYKSPANELKQLASSSPSVAIGSQGCDSNMTQGVNSFGIYFTWYLDHNMYNFGCN